MDDRIVESTRRRTQGLGELGGMVDVVNEIREGELAVGQIPEGSNPEVLTESTEFPRNENATALVIEPSVEHLATLIFMHGLGDNAHGWHSLMPLIDKELPAGLIGRVRYILPNAKEMPVSINDGVTMPAWFDILSMPPTEQEDVLGLRAASDRIDRIIDAEVLMGVPAERIVLAGFSQGAALALHTALRSNHEVAGVVVLSGWLPKPEDYPDALSDSLRENAERLPVFFAHGDKDEVVKLEWARESHVKLEELGLNRLRFVKARGVGHEADAQLLEETAGFIGTSMCSERAVEGRRLQEEAALVFTDVVSAEKMKESEDDESPGYLPTGPSFSELCAMSNIQTKKWFDDWQSSMGWWWQVQPWRNWKNACYIALFNMGVFGLVRAFKRWKAVQFLNKIDELFPPMPPSPPKDGDGGNKEQCETVGEGAAKTKIDDIELPEMPKFPKEFKLPPIIPMPRMLPSWELVQAHSDMLALREREAIAAQLESEAILSDFNAPNTLASAGEALASAAPVAEDSASASMWLSALGGFSAGAVLLIGVSTYKLSRRVRLRQRHARASELVSSPSADNVLGEGARASGLMSS